MSKNKAKETGKNEEALQAKEISQPDIEEQDGQEGGDPSEEQFSFSGEAIENGEASIEGEETQQTPADEPADDIAQAFPSDDFLAAHGLNRAQILAVSPGSGVYFGRMGLVMSDGRKFYEE